MYSSKENAKRQLTALFKVFVTLSTFISSKSIRPIEYATISRSLTKTNKEPLTHEHIGLFAAILGTLQFRVFWSNAAEIEQRLSQRKQSKRSAGDNMCLDTTPQLYCEFIEPKGNSVSEPALGKRKRKAAERQQQPSMLELTKRRLLAFDNGLNAFLEGLPDDSGGLSDAIASTAAAHLPADPTIRRPAKLQSLGEEGGNSLLPTADALIKSLTDSGFYAGQIIDSATRIVPEAEPQYEDLNMPIDPSILSALGETFGIRSFYTHQAQAIRAALGRRDVVVSTSTASGKSVIYQLPILQRLLTKPNSRALMVFPTKALAQDQLRALASLISNIPELSHISISTFDGDTSRAREHRQRISESASVVLTNPDALHAAILPNVSMWGAFLHRLEIVVIDEIHVYTGVFGQSVSHVLSRLQRLCNPQVQFIACSATVSNARDHMGSLIRRDPALIAVVDSDGSPHGKMHMMLWDAMAHRPSLDPGPGDLTLIAAHLLQRGTKFIVFSKYRKTCELIYKDVVDYLDSIPALRHLVSLVSSYRSGYTQHERRQIERMLFSGSTQMVISTSALELGIDVGALDAVVMHGTPLNRTSLWQQAGRAGRRSKDSLVIVVAGGSPIDRRVVKAPEQVFSREFPDILVSNEPGVTAGHLQCAAFERPIAPEEDGMIFGESTPALLSGNLVYDQTYKCWFPELRFKPWPAEKVAIRSIRQLEWQVIEVAPDGSSLALLEELDSVHALYTVYEGGIFLHRGRTYEIDSVDVESKTCFVHRANVSWYTEQRDYTDITPGSAERSNALGLNYGALDIRMTVFGYKRRDLRTKKVVEVVERASPVLHAFAHGVWVVLPRRITQELTDAGFHVEASVHAAEHAILLVASEIVGCSVSDLATECKSPLATRSKVPQIAIYEVSGVAGGPTRRAIDSWERILGCACDRVGKCSCAYKSGCLECTFLSPGCTEYNECLDKRGALVILNGLLSSR